MILFYDSNDKEHSLLLNVFNTLSTKLSHNPNIAVAAIDMAGNEILDLDAKHA